MKILAVFGTRPEAIKMCSLVNKLKKNPNYECRVCVTGQHREMLDKVLTLFDVTPDYDLNVMKSLQSLTSITGSVLNGLESVLCDYTPDLVLVHGDTSTTFASSLAAFYKKIPVGHVEAGLRTNDIYSPWPEEGNRRLTSVLTALHFAPTQVAKENLLAEGIADSSIFVTGNTVIDSLLYMREKLESDKKSIANFDNKYGYLCSDKKLILVTAHRRENFGLGIKNICEAIKAVTKNHSNVQVIYPVHLNPKISDTVRSSLNGVENVFLTEPLDYTEFLYLMIRSYIILTDSGGIQEEAPSLGKPVLVMRDTTERPEALEAGCIELVGTNVDAIQIAIESLLCDKALYSSMADSANPYGDGRAGEKIIKAIQETTLVE